MIATLRHWWQETVPRRMAARFGSALPAVLDRRTVYVLPTSFGLVYAAVIGAIVFGGLNYANNLILAFGFLYATAALIGVLACFRNLDRVAFVGYEGEPAHAGSDLTVVLRFEARDARPRSHLHVCLPGGVPARLDLVAGSVIRVRLPWPADRRGWQALPPLKLSGSWPFGWVECFTWLPLAEPVLVYPALERDPPPFPEQGGGLSQASQSGDAEFRSLREYVPGDPPKHIAWRASARRDTLLVRTYEQPEQGEVLLRWSHTGDLPHEARISRLAAWCVRADATGLRFGLELPGQMLGPDAGGMHLSACLRALALLP